MTAVACWLFMGFFPVMLLTGQVDMPWWGAALATVGLALLMLVIGCVAWFSASEAKADTERLRRAGVPAVAEILSIEVIDPGDGSCDVSRMDLRIAGDGVPSFEAVCRMDHDKKTHRVGARFKAIVDPSDNLFTLQQL